MRQLSRWIAAVVAAVSIPVLSPTVVLAETGAPEGGYQYWAYFASDGAGGAWTAEAVGAGEAVPEDGTVQGWRWANHGDPAREPRALPAFADVCAAAQPGAGQKAVGVVVDAGTTEDGGDADVPEAFGGCAVVDADATGLDVAEAVTDTRLDDGGFVCGLAGYPADGCGVAVPGPVPTDDEQVTLALPADETGSTETGSTDAGSSDTVNAEPSEEAADSEEAAGLNWVAIGIIIVVVIALALALTLRNGRNRADGPDLS